MPHHPLAYHITFGTYGTRLHGDLRGTIDRRHNIRGEPVLGQNDAWRRTEKAILRCPPVFLTPEQREYAEVEIPFICDRGHWGYHIAACQTDHVHVLLTADREGPAVRRWLKRWLGDALSQRWPVPGERTWWAKGGSVKWVWDPGYRQRVFEYIERQRTTP